jgi:carbamoyltransferase
MILGLHFGHDASASLFDESGLVGCILQERLTGIRHDYGLRIETIDLLLETFGIDLSQISRVGVTSTQQMPALTQTPLELRLLHSESLIRDTKLKRVHGFDWLIEEQGLFIQTVNESTPNSQFDSFINENLIKTRGMPSHIFSQYEFYNFADPMWVREELAIENKKILDTARNALSTFELENSINATSLRDQIKVKIRDFVFEGEYWSHHACHAASNVTVDDSDRLIITHDGGLGFQSGGIWNLRNSELKLLALHELELGRIYDYFAERLGLGAIGGAGKLMGLAAYGSSLLFPENPFFGATKDLKDQIEFNEGVSVTNASIGEKLFDLCVNECLKKNLDTAVLGDPKLVTQSAPVEIANFIQRLVEKSFTSLAAELKSRFGNQTLGVSGGFALNCPTNSMMLEKCSFSSVVIEPHCEDGGCSVGAAHLSYMLMRGKSVEVSLKISKNSSYAYKGAISNVSEFADGDEELPINARAIANLISENKVIGIFYGPSEIGPRALGHRSIIANVSFAENWERVNKIKGRETWRPFAPVVLAERLRDFFEGGPEISPFMLFNYRVKFQERSKFPAVTHFDWTSRVQTVSEGDEPFYSILKNLESMGLDPIMMNTSFNGPGQPIVENVNQAKLFFENSELDSVLLNNLLIHKDH